MDKDAGSHVWNYNFSKFETAERKVENFNREEAVGYHGKAGDGEIRHYNSSVTFSGGPTSYDYWLEYKDGDIVNGGWKGKTLTSYGALQPLETGRVPTSVTPSSIQSWSKKSTKRASLRKRKLPRQAITNKHSITLI